MPGQSVQRGLFSLWPLDPLLPIQRNRWDRCKFRTMAAALASTTALRSSPPGLHAAGARPGAIKPPASDPRILRCRPTCTAQGAAAAQGPGAPPALSPAAFSALPRVLRERDYGALDQSHFSLFVQFFRQASPYIEGHRGRTFVLAIPGEVRPAPSSLSVTRCIRCQRARHSPGRSMAQPLQASTACMLRQPPCCTSSSLYDRRSTPLPPPGPFHTLRAGGRPKGRAALAAGRRGAAARWEERRWRRARCAQSPPLCAMHSPGVPPCQTPLAPGKGVVGATQRCGCTWPANSRCSLH